MKKTTQEWFKCHRHSFEKVNDQVKKCCLCGIVKAIEEKKPRTIEQVLPRKSRPKKKLGKGVLSILEAADVLGVSRQRVYTLKQDAHLEGPVGGVTKASIDPYLDKPHLKKSDRKKGVSEHTSARPVAILNNHRIIVIP